MLFAHNIILLLDIKKPKVKSINFNWILQLKIVDTHQSHSKGGVNGSPASSVSLMSSDYQYQCKYHWFLKKRVQLSNGIATALIHMTEIVKC